MPLLDNAPKDSLTQCYTKDSLLPFLEKMWAEYSAYNASFAVMVIDFDGFKALNDKHGHIFGDEALKYFASLLNLYLEDEKGVVFRFGGDEFVIVFPGKTAKEAYRLAVHIEKSLRSRPFLFRGREFNFSFSGGIAACPEDCLDLEGVIEKADKAMYFAKRHGGGRITLYATRPSEFIKWFVRTVITGVIVAMIILTLAHIFKIDIMGTLGRLKDSILREFRYKS